MRHIAADVRFRQPLGDSMGGFALHEAFQRRVAGVSNLHVVQFPLPPTPRPLKRATTARPSPRLAQGARERRTHAPAPHRTTRGHLNNQKIRRFKLQRTGSYRTKIHS